MADNRESSGSGAWRRRCRSAAIAAVVAAAVAVLAGRAATAAEGRVVAVGDIHGDADALAAILQRAQLIDQTHQWIGGTATLVQTGDTLDRGPKVRAALDLLMALEEQAPRSGGRVLTLLGNHETMNMMGDLRDTPPEAFASFADDKSEERRAQAYDAYVKLCQAHSAGRPKVPEIYRVLEKSQWTKEHPLGFFEYVEAIGPEGRYGKWLRSRPAVVQIGDTIFLHGGISADAAHQKPEAMARQVQKELKSFDEYRRYLVDKNLALPWFTLEQLQRVLLAELELVASPFSRVADGNGSGVALQENADPRLLQVIQGLGQFGTWSSVKADGPLWFRGYAMWKPEEGAREIGPILKREEVNHIVVGHTIPASMRITPRFGARVFLIDTGMLTSHYRGGRPSALEIQDGQFTAIYLDETVQLLLPGTPLPPETEDVR